MAALLEPTALVYLIGIGVAVIIALINSLILWGLSKGFKLKKNNYKTAILTAAAIGVVNFLVGRIPNPLPTTLKIVESIVLAFIINAAAIKLFYKLKIGKSALIGLILTAALFVISLVLGIVAGIIFALLYTKGSIV